MLSRIRQSRLARPHLYGGGKRGLVHQQYNFCQTLFPGPMQKKKAVWLRETIRIPYVLTLQPTIFSWCHYLISFQSMRTITESQLYTYLYRPALATQSQLANYQPVPFDYTYADDECDGTVYISSNSVAIGMNFTYSQKPRTCSYGFSNAVIASQSSFMQL